MPIKVFSPVAKSRVSEKPLAARPKDLGGMRVAFLTNTKPNADVYLLKVEELLSARYKFKEADRLNPRIMVHPLLPEFQPIFDKPRDVVVSAWGD